jgi:hypothetical protein
MNTIRVIDSGVIDLTERSEINKVMNNFDFKSDKDIVLDLDKCFISYDTAYLLDCVVKLISDANVEKTIYLKIDYKFISQDTMWDWLFRDTSLFLQEEKADKDNFSIVSAVKEKYNINLVEEK